MAGALDKVADKVAEKLANKKKELKKAKATRNQRTTIVRLQKQVATLEKEIKDMKSRKVTKPSEEKGLFDRILSNEEEE